MVPFSHYLLLISNTEVSLHLDLRKNQIQTCNRSEKQQGVYNPSRKCNTNWKHTSFDCKCQKSCTVFML